MSLTIPPACPTCNGSRLVIEFADNFESLSEMDKMTSRIGFFRFECPTCGGAGSTEPYPQLGEYPPPGAGFKIQDQDMTPAEPKAFILSEDQESAVEKIFSWIESTEQSLTVGGFAGTGKTTIISHLLKELRGEIAICAFTGKAASVLRNKGVPATTMHKLIYIPKVACASCGLTQNSSTIKKDSKCDRCKSSNLKRSWSRVPGIAADLVIVDEASMLNADLVSDIESLAKKILYVGDHGQLEPIGKDPGIMRDPEIKLEHIHRQASGSGIIQLAHHMRRGSHPMRWDGSGFDDARVLGLRGLKFQNLNRFDMIICGYNKTRKAVNGVVRRGKGLLSPIPEFGDRVICLQNDMDLGVFNGQLFSVVRISTSDSYPKYDLVDDFGNEYFDIPMVPDQFVEEKKIDFTPKGIGLFDFGYCMTAHKCQGSEWDSVAVIEQLARVWDPARWRYTAATRASGYLEYWIPESKSI